MNMFGIEFVVQPELKRGEHSKELWCIQVLVIPFSKFHFSKSTQSDRLRLIRVYPGVNDFLKSGDKNLISFSNTQPVTSIRKNVHFTLGSV